MFKPEETENDIFIIAEVGQNHQGQIDKAIDYVEEFARLGADAVKFQMRNIDYLFDSSASENLYDSPTSFGRTYGEHRKALELSEEEMLIIKDKCHSVGVKFMCTPFDEPSLDFLASIETDILKVASFDLGNLPLLDKICSKQIPIVLSLGGGGKDVHISKSVELLVNADLAILHCVSEYPCAFDRLGLSRIPELKLLYPFATIGLSDHFSGVLSGPIGYTAGARVFEKHVTFDRAWKGTDHSFALEPKGFASFVRDLKRTPAMFNRKPEEEIGRNQFLRNSGSL